MPRWLSGETAGRRLQAAARDAVGRDVVWRELGVAFFPPRVVVHDFEVVEPDGRPDLELSAQRIDLRVAWLPLLARQVVVDSLLLDGVALGVVRTAEGIEWPVELTGTEATQGAAATGGAEPGPSREFSLAIRSFRIAGGRVRLADRTVTPPATWELSDLDAELRASALDAPVVFEASGALGSGGSLRAEGSLELEGPLALELALRDIALLPFAPYLGDLQLSGVANGRAELTGSGGAPEAVTANLELRGGVLALDDLRAAGPISLSLSVEELAAPRGQFELDARGAELDYGGAFRKPAGTEARASGRFESQPDGDLRVDIERVKIKNASGSGSAGLGASPQVVVRVAAFDVEGWEALVPALAEYAPRGQLAVPELGLASAGAWRGRVELDGLQLTPPGRDPIAASGALLARGDRVESEALTLTSAGQTLPVELELWDFAGPAGPAAARYRVRSEFRDAEANELLTAFAALPSVLYGATALGADLSGPLGGEVSLVESIAGTVELRVEPGRLHSVSLLRGVFAELGTLGDAALLLGATRGGSTLQRLYGDDFERLSGTFRVADGRARTDDLQLVYRDYRVDLRGGLGLSDQRLDFAGTLTIEPDLEGADASGAGDAQARVIPLAGVTGTLDQPRVRITREAALQLAALLQGDPDMRRRRSKLEEKIDEELGAGSGKQVLDALGGLLGLPPQPEARP